MEIRNLPTDWDEPHIVVGYGIEVGILSVIFNRLREPTENDIFCIVSEPDAYIEFIPLKEE